MSWPAIPHRDGSGNVIPHDDPQMIPAGSHLIRHVLKIHAVPDQNNGGKLRAASAAFAFSTDGSRSMSSDAWEPMAALGLAEDHYARPLGKGAARFPADAARKEAFRVGTEPISGNDHHCGVWQSNPALGTNQTDKALRRLSRASVIVVGPPP